MAQVSSDREYRRRNPWNIPFVFMLVFVGVLIAYNRFNSGEIDQVNFNTFSSDKKIEWLARQADLIGKKEKEISFFREKLAKIDEKYKDYGEDSYTWPANIKLLYDEARKPAWYNLENAVRERNGLAKLYNFNFSKMEKAGFQNKIDKLPKRFDEINH